MGGQRRIAVSQTAAGVESHSFMLMVYLNGLLGIYQLNLLANKAVWYTVIVFVGL